MARSRNHRTPQSTTSIAARTPAATNRKAFNAGGTSPYTDVVSAKTLKK
jgi:hypothetical protein